MKRTLTVLIFLLSLSSLQAQDSVKVDDGRLLDYYSAQQYTEAVNYLEGFYKPETESKKGLTLLAYAYLMAGRLSEAEKQYLKLNTIDSGNIQVLSGLAAVSSQKGDVQQAKERYEAILAIDSTNFNAIKQLALLSKNALDINRVKYLRKANDLNNADGEIALELSQAYLRMEFYDRASAVLDAALAADSTNLKLLEVKLPVNIAVKKYDLAIETGKFLLAHRDSSVFVLENLGKAYYLSLDYQNALRCFLLTETRSKDKEATYFNIARSYRGIKDYINAVTYLQKAIKTGVSPMAASYYGLLGDSYENLNKNDEADKAYKKGLDFENDGSLLYNIALLYENKRNDKKSAISYYEQYLKTLDKQKQAKLIRFINNKIEELKR
ncbi:tetratricopeptide repeat protein [Pedobacter sp. JY14-1]|uniref:tetratricopeptide repeat protein n=1 Tax=Pedobacter sp. JY14-1 TaxID=3034151 RepID=UPI0023E19442|nr:tetratricopeptide repeat protein [Pedobacter sp. JY14-1]